MAQYDPSVIQKQAKKLYAKARWVYVKYLVLSLVLGVMIFGTLIYAMRRRVYVMGVPVTIFVAMILANEKSFRLRLQAQELLCKLHTEQNTRAIYLQMKQQGERQWDSGLVGVGDDEGLRM